MKEKITFEQALSRLEEIVSRMEKGDLTLDESIKCYKEGLDLSNYCNEVLQDAEKEIIILK